MDATSNGPTHRRLLIGHLFSVAAIIALAVAIMLLVAEFSTREFAVFLFGAGSLVGCLGLAHSHALKCAHIQLDPGSKPGAELWIVPIGIVAGLAGLLFWRADAIPDTPLASGSVAAATFGVAWAVLRGGRAIQRIGSTRS
jgi:hypothetical protein